MSIQNFYQEHKNQINFILIGIAIGILLSLFVPMAFQSKPEAKEDKETFEVTKVDTETEKETKQVVTVDIVSKKLANLSELSTAEMIYTGLYSVTEGKIPFLTKKGFSMLYEGNVRAGIDPSLVNIQVDDQTVTVTIPPAEIQLVKIDPNSIRFYDEKKALFNPDEKSDVTDAVSIAEGDLKERANTDGLLERANQQAKYIVEGILEGAIGERELKIK